MSWWCDGCGDNFSICTEPNTVVCDMDHEHSYCDACWKDRYEKMADKQTTKTEYKVVKL